MLSAEEISAMSAVRIADLLDTCVIVRPTSTSDSAGGRNPSTETRIGPLACEFRATSGDEEIDEAIAVHGDYVLRLAANQTILSTDRVEVLGGLYNVVWTPAPAALQLLRYVGLKEAV